MQSKFILAGVALFAAFGVAQAYAQEVSFTDDQATAGKKIFGSKCVSCHGEELDGGVGGGPPLVGDYFFSQWGGKPVSEVYGFIHTNMPEDAPGTLSEADTAKVLTYILQSNGFKSGSDELPADASKLTAVLNPPAQ